MNIEQILRKEERSVGETPPVAHESVPFETEAQAVDRICGERQSDIRSERSAFDKYEAHQLTCALSWSRTQLATLAGLYYGWQATAAAAAITTTSAASSTTASDGVGYSALSVAADLDASKEPATVNDVELVSPDVRMGAGGKACRNRKSDRRPRTTFTAEQTAILEHEYAKHEYIPKSKRLKIADVLSLNEGQIKIWFQNRRAKEKRIEKALTDGRYRCLETATLSSDGIDNEVQPPSSSVATAPTILPLIHNTNTESSHHAAEQ